MVMKSYEIFKEEIKEKVFHILSQTQKIERIELKSVLKNNNQNLDGLLIHCSGNNISPCIYLNDYFKDYQNGEPIDTIAHQVAVIYQKNKEIDLKLPNISDFSCIKDSIFPKIINYEQNMDFLKDKPYTLVQDMAVIYQIKIYEKNTDIGTITISNTFADAWKEEIQNTDIVQELHSISIENMKRQTPPIVKSMKEIFLEGWQEKLDKLGVDMKLQGEFLQDMFLQDEFLQDVLKNDPQQYVLTNQNKINGAAVILDNDFMQEVAEKLGGDFYILPSSIHEFVAQPIKGSSMSLEEINAMIAEINETQVGAEEVLCNKAYAYDSINKEIYIAGQDRLSELKKEFSLPIKGETAKKEQQIKRKEAYTR